MNYWLMKSEPSTFSIDDLKNKSKKTEHWDGVRNYQARNMIRDEMQVGDFAFFYHSNCQPPGIVGTMKIVKAAYPDFTQFDPQSPYFDEKSNAKNPRWFMVDVQFQQKFNHMITLEQIKAEPALSNLALVRKGNRLSIMPITKQEWDVIMHMI